MSCASVHCRDLFQNHILGSVSVRVDPVEGLLRRLDALWAKLPYACLYKFSANMNSSFLLKKCPKVLLLDLVVLSCFSKHSGYAISHSHEECVSSGLSQWLSVFSLIKNVAFSSSCRLVVKSPCGFILHFPRPKTHFSVFSSLALLLLQGSTSSLTSQTTVFHMCVLEIVFFAVLTYPRIIFDEILGYSK